MARHFKGSGHIVRFIEYMDVGATNGWRMDDVVPAAEIVRTIDAELPLRTADPNYAGEVAERWRYSDGSGEIGVIASVTQAFCRDCTRARLSTDGKLYTCLFATDGHDLRALLRGGADDARDRQRDRRGLARARRPLLRNPHREHGANAEGRDELHRRLRRPMNAPNTAVPPAAHQRRAPVDLRGPAPSTRPAPRATRRSPASIR